MIRVLVSACLLGERVRYHGGDARCESGILERWKREGRLVSVCPELAGGLPVPRPPAEIVGGDAGDVLRRAASVRDGGGNDLGAAFRLGARAALDAALANGARLAVLKDGSPSCATSRVHDGSFRGRRVAGQGVAAALLSQAGIRVFGEHQLADAAEYLESLEGAAHE